MLENLRVLVRRTCFRLSSNSRQRLWQRIGSLSRSGVPIAEALEFLHESRTVGSITSGFIEHQRVAIRSGGFSAGARGWVPKEELIIIEVTQEGDIADGFAQAARIASVRSQLRSTLVAGLTYPTLLLFAGGTVIAVLPGYALDVMIDLVDPSRWPPVSRSVLAFSEFMSNWGLVCAAAVITLLIASIWSAPRWSGSVRQKLDWYPPFALYRKFTGPEILSAWLALMQSGIQRIRALAQLESGLPEYLASHVRTMRSRLYRGDPVEIALDTGLFSAETLDDLRIYERIGDFGEHAERIAEEDIARALAKLDSATKTLSSLLLVAIGAMAVWIYVGIARVAFTVQQTIY